MLSVWMCTCMCVFICGGVCSGDVRSPLTCSRSYNVPGGGLGHGVGQSLPEAFVGGVGRADVVPRHAKALRPATAYFQQGHATPVKRTCMQRKYTQG